MISNSHFPILIEYTETGEQVVILSPNDIESGKAFKVLKTEGQLWGDEWVFPENDD